MFPSTLNALGAESHLKYVRNPENSSCLQCHLNVGHYLVDDRTKNGADRFTGEHILFGSERFPDWTAVTAYLRINAA